MYSMPVQVMRDLRITIVCEVKRMKRRYLTKLKKYK